jgi:enamine deaminase RidA (YjgF/YER057c/UK114 family)
VTAPIASGWSGCRVGLAPTGKRRLVTAHARSRHPDCALSGVIRRLSSGGITVWVAGQTATQDSQGNNIANNFEAQVKQVFAQIDGVLKRAGGSLDNIVTMTVFIKESRYGDKFVEMRKDFFKNGNYPGSALITVTNFARPGIEIEIQAVGVVGDTCSHDNPCSAEGKTKKAQK